VTAMLQVLLFSEPLLDLGPVYLFAGVSAPACLLAGGVADLRLTFWETLISIPTCIDI
jgi:hypothetical protein